MKLLTSAPATLTTVRNTRIYTEYPKQVIPFLLLKADIYTTARESTPAAG